MERKDTEQLRQKLEFQRQEILHFLSRIEDESRLLDLDSPQDITDRCVISVSKGSLFERSSQRRTILRLIEAALRRIGNGSFGVCVGCGDGIRNQRLQALPWTQFCLRCQEALEEEVGESLSARTPVPPAPTWRRAG